MQSESQSDDHVEKSESYPAEPVKRRRGRPPGSKTLDVEHVHIVPTSCPRCGCTEHVVINVVLQRSLTGQHKGFSYNRVTWRNVRCQCGQRFRTITYRMIEKRS